MARVKDDSQQQQPRTTLILVCRRRARSSLITSPDSRDWRNPLNQQTIIWPKKWDSQRFLQGRSLVFSHLNRSAPDALCPRAILNILKLIKTISLLDSLLWMKLGFITTNSKPKNNQSNGGAHHLRPQRRPRSFLQLERSWPLFSEISRVWYRLNRATQWMNSIILDNQSTCEK